MPDSVNKAKTVAILGAGPVGLAAAAHVLERGMEPIVLEAGPEAAHAVRQWSHVRMFSPCEYNIDKAAERLLAKTGWNSPVACEYPTGGELVAQYLEPLATRTPLRNHIKTNSRVTAVGRSGFDKMKNNGRAFEPFTIRYQNGKGPEQLKADAVIDATGTWLSPNPAGADGLPAIGEEPGHPQIAYGMPDALGAARARYAAKTVAVLGAGHSAVGTLIDLARLKDEAPATEIIWLLRGDQPEKAFGGGANDKLVARGELGAAFAALVTTGRIRVESEFRVANITADGARLNVATGSGSCCRQLIVDELIVATGFRQHQFDAPGGLVIAGDFGGDGADLFIAGQHQEGRCAAVGLHAGEVEAGLVLCQFARAVRPHGAAAVLVRIDQRRQRHRAFDRGIKLDAKLAHEVQVRPETGRHDQFVDDDLAAATA